MVLLLCACITLWIVWFVYAKGSQTDFLNLATKAQISINFSTLSWTSMIFGIIFLTAILVGAILLFTELMRVRIAIKQNADLSSAFTHELATPLTCISMNIEALIESTKLTEEKKKDLLRGAHVESQKMQRSLDKIFAAKKIDYNQLKIKKNTHNINYFLKKFYRSLTEEFPNSHFIFHDHTKKEIYANIDPHYFEIALMNITENSVKYSGVSTAQISITLESWNTIIGKHIRISIKDNGPGISSNKLKKIFNPFYKVNNQTRGNGLGLYIVKSIVKKHRGKVWAKSEENDGCLLIIQLPRCKQVSYL